MKRLTALILALVLLLGTTALAAEPDGYVATGGWIPDRQTYSGTWQQAYRQILNNHSAAIHAYQARTLDYYLNGSHVRVPCKPVEMTDITSDGVPELIFMEAANEERGDLYIYSPSGAGTRCVLYVPGITRLGYDDVGMGFDLYLSSADGGTLVAEYDEYEWPWVLQLSRSALGQYALLSWLRAEYDNGDWDNDRFFRNGSPVSREEYDAALATLRNGRITTLSAYTTNETNHYGFSLDWESAVAILPASAGPGTQYDEGGTYSVKNQWIRVLARAWDDRNGIWWVKCEIPYHGEIRVLWTGWKRFDHSSMSLDSVPEEFW